LPWRRPRRASRLGVRNIMRAVLTEHCGDPLNCHKNFGHSLRLYFNVFASPSKGWGLGKGTAFESPSPDSPVEARSSFSPFPSSTINCTVAPRESAGSPRAPWPIHRRSHRSSCALRPCAETSGNIAFFSPLAFPLLESVPIASVPIQGSFHLPAAYAI
jgi:hypothetical protein